MADNEVKIVTKLDPTQAEKGIKSVNTAIENVVKNVDKMGGAVQNAVKEMSKAKMPKSDYLDGLEDAYKKAKDMRNQSMIDANSAKSAKDLDKEIISTVNSIEKLNEKIEEAKVRLAMVAQLQEKVNSLNKAADDAHASGDFNAEVQYLEQLVDVNRQLKEAKKSEGKDTSDIARMTEQVINLKSELVDAIDDKERLLAAESKEIATQGFENSLKEIEVAQEQARAQEIQGMERMKAAQDAYTQRQREAWAQANPGISAFNAAIKETAGNITKLAGVVTHPIQTMQQGFAGLGKNIVNSFAGAGASILNAVNHPIQALSKLKTIAVSALKAANVAFIAFGNSAKQAFSGIGKLAKSAFGSLLGVLKKINPLMAVMNKRSRSLGRSFQMGFRNILQYAIGIRSLFALFTKLRSAITDGMKNLAQFSRTTNASLSSLKSSFTQLKNSLATAFDPILTAITPALTKLINLLSTAATYAAMLFAALTGKKIVAKATGVQQDYAKELKGTAGGAKKAADAQEELNNSYLAGIDDLHKYNDENKDNSGGGGGGASPEIAFEEVEVPDWAVDLAEKIKKSWENADFTELGYELAENIANALDKIPWNKIKANAAKLGKSLATLLNGIFANLDFAESLGRTIGEGINTAIEFAYEFVRNFNFKQFGLFVGTALKTAFETIEWEKLGQTIGLGINGIFATIEGFFSTPDLFTTIGNKIFVLLYNIFNILDPEQIGAGIHAFVKGIIDLFVGAFGNGKWDSLKELIGEKLRGIWDAIGGDGDLAGKIGQAVTLVGLLAAAFELLSPILSPIIAGFGGIAGVLPTVVTALSGLGVPLPIAAAGAGLLAGALGGLLAAIGVIFIAAIDKATGAITGLCNIINDFIENTDFAEIGTTVGKKITDAVNSFDWSLLGETAANMVNALLEFISSAVSNTDWRAVANAIVESIGSFFGNIDWAIVGETISALITGLLDFLIGLVVDTDWGDVAYGIYDAVGTTILNIDWSTILWDVGVFLIDGLLGGILEALVGIGKYIYDKLVKPIIDAVCDGFGIHSPSTVFAGFGRNIIEGLLNGLKEKIKSIIDFFKTNFDNIKKTIDTAWNKIKTTTSTAWNNVKTTITNVWNNIKTGVSTAIENVKTTLSNVMSTIKSAWDTAWSNIKNKVDTIWNNIKTFVTNTINNVKTTLSNVMSSIKGTWDNVWNGMKTTVSSVWSGISSSINSIIGGVESMANKVGSAINGITSGINNVTSKISSATKVSIPKIPTVKKVNIPRLATGAVIPANKEFMAVLGDQKHGNNIEAPEGLIRKIVREESGQKATNNSYEFVAQINRKTVFDEVIKEARMRRDATGRNPFEFA